MVQTPMITLPHMDIFYVAHFLYDSVPFFRIFCLSFSKYKLFNLKERIFACVFLKSQIIHMKTDDDPKIFRMFFVRFFSYKF